MSKKLKRIWVNIRYRLLSDIRYGDGIFGKVYESISKHYNPVKPWYWRKVKAPLVDLPTGYGKIVPLAYSTGDSWDLHWGALYEGEDRNIYDAIFPEPLCDLAGIDEKADYSIYEWPFFIPYASSKNLEKAGFYLV